MYCDSCKFYFMGYCTYYNTQLKRFDSCSDFVEGVHSNRFWLKPIDKGISTGFDFELNDKKGELKDKFDNFIVFDNEYDGELLCDFLNKYFSM